MKCKNEKNWLAYTWELPQALIAALIIWVIGGDCNREWGNDAATDIVWYKVERGLFGGGICLGEYILFDAKRRVTDKDILHEYGHCKQSRMLGPLYLFVVGIPSIIRNIYDRIAHKKWTSYSRKKWYYKGWPENWADKLGGVQRQF